MGDIRCEFLQKAQEPRVLAQRYARTFGRDKMEINSFVHEVLVAAVCLQHGDSHARCSGACCYVDQGVPFAQ